MTQQMNGILVIIASPGDTAEERAVVREQINDWNINNGRRMGVVLLPWLYERSSVPKLGGRPQAIINSQAVDQADVVVAFFGSRLGSRTGVDVSGTAEEIRRAHDSGKPVHVYFSTEDLPHDVDLVQQQALRDFRADLQNEGLLGTYSDPADLAGQVINALMFDIDEAGWSGMFPGRVPRTLGANLKWHHEHKKEQTGVDKNGRTKYKTTKNQLILQNVGDRAAENVTFQVFSLDDTPLHGQIPTEPFTIQPDSSRAWTLIAVGHATIQIDATWTENGETVNQTWTITVEAS